MTREQEQELKQNDIAMAGIAGMAAGDPWQVIEVLQTVALLNHSGEVTITHASDEWKIQLVSAKLGGAPFIRLRKGGNDWSYIPMGLVRWFECEPL